MNAQLSDPEIFKDYEKASSLQARAEEIETLLLEKLERWEMLEGKQNGGDFEGSGSLRGSLGGYLKNRKQPALPSTKCRLLFDDGLPIS